MTTTEPPLHHLTTLYRDSVDQMNELFAEIDSLEKDIAALNPPDVGVAELTPLEKRIDDLITPHEVLLDSLSDALKTAWHANQADVIDKFSTLKERIQKSLTMAVGHGHEAENGPTGLYRLLEDRLFAIYENGEFKSPLRDNDSAMDALERFGIWDLKGYWSLGIISGFSDLEQLDEELKSKSPEERIEMETKYTEEARQHLAELGLTTVRDLKDAYIFSKKSLQEYLALD